MEIDIDNIELSSQKISVITKFDRCTIVKIDRCIGAIQMHLHTYTHTTKGNLILL